MAHQPHDIVDTAIAAGSFVRAAVIRTIKCCDAHGLATIKLHHQQGHSYGFI
jgi:hypothetical protein